MSDFKDALEAHEKLDQERHTGLDRRLTTIETYIKTGTMSLFGLVALQVLNLVLKH